MQIDRRAVVQFFRHIFTAEGEGIILSLPGGGFTGVTGQQVQKPAGYSFLLFEVILIELNGIINRLIGKGCGSTAKGQRSCKNSRRQLFHQGHSRFHTEY